MRSRDYLRNNWGMRIHRVVLLLASTTVLSSCAQAPAGPTFARDDIATIVSTVEDFEKNFNAKDVEKITAQFSANGVMMPPNHATSRARDAIKQYFVGRFGEGVSDMQLEAKDVGGSGPLAYASGDYRLTITPTGGQPYPDRGKFVWLLRDTDGRWLVDYVIFNSDFAPHAAAAAAAPAS